MTFRFPFEVLIAEGSNFEIGFQVGSRFKDKIRSVLENKQISEWLECLSYVDNHFDDLRGLVMHACNA